MYVVWHRQRLGGHAASLERVIGSFSVVQIVEAVRHMQRHDLKHLMTPDLPARAAKEGFATSLEYLNDATLTHSWPRDGSLACNPSL